MTHSSPHTTKEMRFAPAMTHPLLADRGDGIRPGEDPLLSSHNREREFVPTHNRGFVLPRFLSLLLPRKHNLFCSLSHLVAQLWLASIQTPAPLHTLVRVHPKSVPATPCRGIRQRRVAMKWCRSSHRVSRQPWCSRRHNNNNNRSPLRRDRGQCHSVVAPLQSMRATAGD